MKPAEIKKRARKLAKEGKIVDAIRALENLTSGDNVDPYDLVMMGDLCMRAGRSEDARASYQRAVETYRDSKLHRNGIALCKKVLRTHPSAEVFTLLMGELCEREGLVPDAVDAYLEYAEPLDPEDVRGKPPWLESLATLTPRSTGLLTRQAELLVRWDHAKDAIALLRRAAESANTPDQRAQLQEIAGQVAELGGAFDDAEAALSTEMPSPELKADPQAGSFDQAYLRDLSFDELEARKAEPDPEPEPEPRVDTAAAPEPAEENAGPVYDISETADENPSEMMDFMADTQTIDISAGENASRIIDLDAERRDDPNASQFIDLNAEPGASRIIDLNAEQNASQMFEISAGDERGVSEDTEEHPALSLNPGGTDRDRSGDRGGDVPEGLETFGRTGRAEPQWTAPEQEMLDEDPSVDWTPSGSMRAPERAHQHTDAQYAQPETSTGELISLRNTLEVKLQSNPFDVAVLEKLVEVCLAQGDSVSVLDLRERLAQAMLQEGRPESALEQYRKIYEADASREDIRERHDRLAAELGGSTAGAARGASRREGGERSESLFNVRGLSKVEVRDDGAPSSEDDMVDLGALLDEFRDGLSSSMADAPPRAHYDLGLSHMEMGLLEEAAASFAAAAEHADIEPEAREMWGRCLRLLNRNAESISVLRTALARRSDSLGIRYQLGVSLETAGERDEALRLFQSIVRVDPNYEDIKDRITSLGGSDCTTQPPESSS